MSDVRLSSVIFKRRASIQCSLYARLTSASGPPSRRSRLRFLAVSSWKSAASSSVRMSFPESSFGRWRGVLVASFHTPCRSGSPHGVLGGAQPLAAGAGFTAFGAAVAFSPAFAGAVDFGAWPATADNERTAIAAPRIPIEIKKR